MKRYRENKKMVRLTLRMVLSVVIILVNYKCFAIGVNDLAGNSPLYGDKVFYLGYAATLGSTGNFFPETDISKRDPSFSFFFDLCYYDSRFKWGAFTYYLGYKKFYLKYNDELEGYDFLGFGINLDFTITKFLIGFGFSINYPLNSKNVVKKTLNFMVNTGFGYIFRLRKNKIFLVKFEFLIDFIKPKENMENLIYGIYLKFSILTYRNI